MKTIKDFLECDLLNNYDYVEVCDYYNNKVIIPRMKIKELWQHFHDTENYTADEFEIITTYLGGSFLCEQGFYSGYITLLVRYEAC